MKVGETIEAKIIAIDKERLSLSMKQLTDDPWLSEVEGLKRGDEVEGTITYYAFWSFRTDFASSRGTCTCL